MVVPVTMVDSHDAKAWELGQLGQRGEGHREALLDHVLELRVAPEEPEREPAHQADMPAKQRLFALMSPSSAAVTSAASVGRASSLVT